MDAEAPRVRREFMMSADGACGLGAIATAFEPVLLEAAGPGASCVSVSLELARTPAAGATLAVEAWVERATRTLVFAAAEAHVDGERAASGSAIFSRAET